VNRIDETFIRLKEKKQKAFIPYIVAGVPGVEETVTLALELEKMGADVLELGYPFSDPIADGVINQTAANRALELGVTDAVFLSIVTKIRAKSQMPIVVFSYVNPLFRLGFEDFARKAKAAGADGFLLVDVPVEESQDYQRVTRALDQSLIFLAAPTTTPARLERVLRESSGFLYYVSRTGITGERDSFQQDFESKVAKIKAASRLPVVVGFGISTPEHVRTVCRLADGVAVGSALVRRTLEKKPFAEMLKDFKAFAAPLAAPTKETWI
jgi:tryptophan synthase alpha chain